jgi:repressor LexA
MMTVGENIRKFRESNHMTQKELAEKLNVRQTAVSYWETNKRQPDLATIRKMCAIFNMNLIIDGNWSQFTSADIKADLPNNRLNNSKYFTIPVLGSVAAGIPIDAIEDIVDQEDLNAEYFREPPKEYFGVRIKGHSMEPRICDGDTVIVHQQDDAESDQIVIVNVDGDFATCKRLKKYRDSIALVSLNPAYEPMLFSAEQVEKIPVRIRGVVVELRGKV